VVSQKLVEVQLQILRFAQDDSLFLDGEFGLMALF
jgi:hypothetical protein